MPKARRTTQLDGKLQARVRATVAEMANAYGRQGWWPVCTEKASFLDANLPQTSRGYHPGLFDLPRTRKGRWEISTGAVLTQNTAWTNVEKALAALRAHRLLTPESILATPFAQLGSLIRPAGYYNQKSGYLKAVAQWFLMWDQRLTRLRPSRCALDEVRPELLAVKGVGPETADSILLYAYALPTFVVDAYTRRVLVSLGAITKSARYAEVRQLLEAALAEPDDRAATMAWQEAHALFVEHAKRHHRGTGSSAKQGI